MIPDYESIIEDGRSKNGGWSRDQLSLLGIPWPPPKNWKKHISKNPPKTADWDAFLELKDRHLELEP